MHVTSALVVLLLVETVLTPTTMRLLAGGFTAFAWTLEITRRRSPRWNDTLMRALGVVAHAHERHQVNSSTWYTTALFLLSLFTPPAFCAIAIVVLGLGDPAAALIGRRWGRTRLASGRSLEGSLAFVVVGLVSAWIALTIFHPELPHPALYALGGALAGAIAELLTRRIDDNFAIPLAAAAGAGLVGLVL